MQRQTFLSSRGSVNKISDGQARLGFACLLPNVLPSTNTLTFWLLRSRVASIKLNLSMKVHKINRNFQRSKFKSMSQDVSGELLDEYEDLCPVECVREFNTDAEFSKILEKANETDSLVVVDFYRTSCGSCKYIAQGFSKLCKGAGDREAPVIFLKHNVMDEYDEQSEVAERLRIKAVPLFHFYKNGILLEAFPTRDKEKIVAAILKYTSLTSEGI